MDHKKKYIKLVVKNEEKNTIYTGRFIGKVKNKMLYHLLKSPELVKRVSNVATISLIDVIKNVNNIEGERFAITIKTKDPSKDQGVLFISEEIKLVAYQYCINTAVTRMIATNRSETCIETLKAKLVGKQGTSFEITEYYKQ